MKRVNFLAVVIGLIVFSAQGLAQTTGIKEQLSKVAGKNAENYLSPFLSGLGADLNSGFYHSADLHGVLGFDIGVKVVAVIVKDEDKQFDFLMPNGTTVKAPTVVGSDTGSGLFFPKGLNLSAVPLIVPQASIGLPFGLEVTGRFIPSTPIGDAGKVSFVGFGLRHDIDQYLPLFPVDIAVHFMTQSVTFNDKDGNKIMSASATAFGAEVSKSLLMLTLYGGFQIEKSSWEIASYKNPANVDILGFTVDGKNKSRFHAGVRLLLLFINVHADYSFAPNPVATAGVGITFR